MNFLMKMVSASTGLLRNRSTEYDSSPLRAQLIYPDDTNVTYEYDSMSRLTKVNYEGSPVAQYSYDELSRRTLVTLGNDAKAVYEYDIANRLTKLTNNINDVNITFFLRRLRQGRQPQKLQNR